MVVEAQTIQAQVPAVAMADVVETADAAAVAAAAFRTASIVPIAPAQCF